MLKFGQPSIPAKRKLNIACPTRTVCSKPRTSCMIFVPFSFCSGFATCKLHPIQLQTLSKSQVLLTSLLLSTLMGCFSSGTSTTVSFSSILIVVSTCESWQVIFNTYCFTSFSCLVSICHSHTGPLEMANITPDYNMLTVTCNDSHISCS